jgi:hypothetical protein
MREIIVRFEDAPGPAGAADAVVNGSVTVTGRADRPPFRFDGWLQLLGLLEDLSAMTDDGPEPPRPLPGAGAR